MRIDNLESMNEASNVELPKDFFRAIASMDEPHDEIERLLTADGPEGDVVRREYDITASENGLHPDDDFEEVLDMMVANFEDMTFEGYKVLPNIDKERYTEMPGLEGPFQTMSGKPIYYDPKEGAYYDRDTDMYLTYDEFKALDEGRKKNKNPMGPQGIAVGDRVEHEGEKYEVLSVDGDILTVDNLQNGNRTQFRMDDVTKLFGMDAMTDQDKDNLDAMFKRLKKAGSGSLKHVATEADELNIGAKSPRKPKRFDPINPKGSSAVDPKILKMFLKNSKNEDYKGFDMRRYKPAPMPIYKPEYRKNNRYKPVPMPGMPGFGEGTVDESGIMYRAGVKKYGKEGMKKIQSAAGSGASAEEIGAIKDKYNKKKTEGASPHPKGSAKYKKHMAAKHANMSEVKKRKVSMSQVCEAVKQNDPTKAVAQYVRTTLDPSYKTWDQVREQTQHIISCINEGHTIDIENVMHLLQRTNLQEQADKNMLIKENIDTLRMIVADKSAMPVKFKDGTMKVDMTTASIFIQMYDRMKERNQEKISDMIKTKSGFLKVLDFFYGAMK